MLWSVALIFILLWVIGLITAYTLGGFIHVLVGLAVALLLIRIFRGPRKNRSRYTSA